jgi:iron complex transport system substrate-binding protein
VSAREAIEWPRLNLEHVVMMAPEVVVTAAHTRARLDDALRRWKAQSVVLPAARTGRVHDVNPDLLHRPGPRIVDGLEALARAIHPGALP